MGDSLHLSLDWYGDLLLDLLRGAPRPLRNHLHPGIGDVRVSLDRQSMEGDDAPNEKDYGHTEDDEAVVESKIDNGSDHYCSAAFSNSRAFATTCWPGLIPDSTACMFPA